MRGGADREREIAYARIERQEDDRCIGKQRADLAGDLKAALPRHRVVEHEKVRLELERLAGRIDAVNGLADHGKLVVRSEDRANALADGEVVVRDDDAGRHASVPVPFPPRAARALDAWRGPSPAQGHEHRLARKAALGIGPRSEIGRSPDVTIHDRACRTATRAFARFAFLILSSLRPMGAGKILLVVAHPAIATGLETLLKLEGDYDVRRLPNFTSWSSLGGWRPDAALVDGTLLASQEKVVLGVPALVLSGNEDDGKALAAKLDDGRGWMRKDATGEEFSNALSSLLGTTTSSGIGIATLLVIAVLAIIAVGVIAYLVWLAAY